MDFVASDVVSAPATVLDLLLRLGMGAGLGGAIGLNREWEQKPAGFRTHALVGLGSGLFALVGVALVEGGPIRDDAAASR